MFSCSRNDDEIYTLYRDSVLDNTMRVHVATFDVKNDHKFNMETCEQARNLFQNQPDITTRFWCEKGRFKE